MELIQEILTALFKGYLMISMGHVALFLIISTSMSLADAAKGKSRKEVKKNRISIWNGFVWPKFWYGIIVGSKGNDEGSKRSRD